MNNNQPTPPDNGRKEEFADKFLTFLSEFGSFVWDLTKTALVVMVLAFLFRYFIVEPFIVQGASMEPNYHNFDYILIEKVSVEFNQDYRRGAVVIFHPPDNPSQNYIKRTIGLPNETIFIRNGNIVIQNKKNPKGFILNEPYLASNIKTEGTTKTELGADEYFFLGDNRANSKDSRSFGPVKESQIIGRAWITVYSKNGPAVNHLPDYSKIQPAGQ